MINEMSFSARIATDNTLMAILNVRDLENGQDLIIEISAPAGPILVVAMGERYERLAELVNPEKCLGTSSPKNRRAARAYVAAK